MNKLAFFHIRFPKTSSKVMHAHLQLRHILHPFNHFSACASGQIALTPSHRKNFRAGPVSVNNMLSVPFGWDAQTGTISPSIYQARTGHCFQSSSAAQSPSATPLAPYMICNHPFRDLSPEICCPENFSLHIGPAQVTLVSLDICCLTFLPQHLSRPTLLSLPICLALHFCPYTFPLCLKSGPTSGHAIIRALKIYLSA